MGFTLERGQSLALIGESGSGKSTIARTVLRLLPPEARILGGQVRFGGRDVLAAGERQFRPLRGRQLGFVPQDPGSALNAVRTIGSQALEAAALLPEARRGRAARHASLRPSTWSGWPTPSGSTGPTRTSSPAACSSGC